MMSTGVSLIPLVVAALAAVLAPPVAGRRPLVLTALLAIMAGAAVLSEGVVTLVLLAAILTMLLLMCWRAESLTPRHRAWGIATYAVGLVSLLIAAVTDGPLSAVTGLIACAALLPLFPLHGGYVAAVSAAPGALQILVAVAAPVVGLHGVLDRIVHLPGPALNAVAVLALAGVVYGSLRALVQSRAVLLVSYAAVTFFSMLWWYLAAVRVPTQPTVVYGGSVALATGGLLLAWQVLQARYGDVALDQIRGLARPMPRFAFLFLMLMVAAMGLPPFGVFSGYVGMLLAPMFTPSGGLILVLLAWLTASWYLLTMVQRVLFGRHRTDLLYDDLRPAEAVSLAIVLAGLLGLGLLSDSEVAPTSTGTSVSAQETGLTWNR